LYILLGVIGIYIIFRILKIIFPLKKKLFLSARVKAKADRKFNKLLHKFKQTHHRKPTRNDIFRIIINASHITIRRRGHKGHWGRQKVRKYLLEKHNVMKEYRMK